MHRFTLRTITSILAIMLLGGGVFAQQQRSAVSTVVIDAGHGGSKYPGATRKLNGKTIYEKDLNLQVALKLGKLIQKEMPDVKVVYTRTTDKQLGATLKDDLQARADIAHKANGDLFISIHSNASKSTALYGTMTLVMGESDFERSDNDGAIAEAYKDELIDMSDASTAAAVRAYIKTLQFTFGEYSNRFAQIVQKQYKSNGGRTYRDLGVRKQLLKVLYATNMPSVLTEIGFMSNPTELKYISSEKGQNEIARSLCSAVKEYRTLLDKRQTEDNDDVAPAQTSGSTAKSSVSLPTSKPATTTTTASKPTQSVSGTTFYTIQVLSSTKRVSKNSLEFKTYKGKATEYITDSKFKYKYCIGKYGSQSEANKALIQMRKTFKDAYVVGVNGGKLTTASAVKSKLKK